MSANIQGLRRQSVLSSSNPTSDYLPIDCILVYDRVDPERESEVENNHSLYKKHKKLSERRKKFEEYLTEKHRLILQHVVSRLKIFQ